jgi:hypothetical protein
MRLQKKSLSRVSLMDLLRRKRTNLEKFLSDSGIVTYELLKQRCASMGAVPPTIEQFNKVKGNAAIHDVSSPTEGVVVLNPPQEQHQKASEVLANNEKIDEGNLKVDLSGNNVDASPLGETAVEAQSSPEETPQQIKSKKKKQDQQNTQ